MRFVLDAYAARSCPVKTHNAFHPGVHLAGADESLGEAFHGGLVFADEVYAEVIATATGSVVDLREQRDRPRVEQEASCLAAMDAGVDLILGGLLPRDWHGHRAGRPQVLVRDPEGGYAPVLIKSQRLLETRGDQSLLTVASLGSPADRREVPGLRYRWSWRLNAALQVAHHFRLLESLGRSSATAWAGLIGTDEVPGEGRVVTWLRLDEPSVPPSPASADDDPAPVSVLARYDAEFARRVAIAAEAAAQGPDDPPVMLPIVNRECTYCQWFSVCRPQLSDDDLSVRINKAPLDVHEIAVLRDLGVATVTELAHTDLEALLPRYLPRVTHRAQAEERLRLAHRRSVLMERGVDFDRVTTGAIPLPRAELEIDIDVETSADDRVYLWGFLVTDARTGTSSYHHVSSFTDLDDGEELALAETAMQWLSELVADRDARVFHYSEYEVWRLHRLVEAGAGPAVRWAKGFARDHFVDLFAPIRAHFFGTQGLGLKVVANRAAGFSWRDETPGGLNSQSWFSDAVHAADAAVRAQARQRVLEYNEDDVRATWHVRRWLRSLG